MKSIKDAWFIHIEITNYCNRNCLYCSRFERYIPEEKKYHMDLETFEAILNSLKNWKNRIALIGGEPVLHPQFEELCLKIQSYFSKEKLGIWVSTFGKHEKIIRDTFGFIAYNPHNKKDVCFHQPITIASQDVVKYEKLRKALIDDCWVQRTWCPSINPQGGYFCEVAAAMGILYNVPGYSIFSKWLDYTPEQFQDQVDEFCNLCGMCIPMERQSLENKIEKISPSVLNLLFDHHCNIPDNYELIDNSFTAEQLEEKAKTWTPGNYRGDVYSDDCAPEGLGTTIDFKRFLDEKMD